jgi:hypothetical protein
VRADLIARISRPNHESSVAEGNFDDGITVVCPRPVFIDVRESVVTGDQTVVDNELLAVSEIHVDAVDRAGPRPGCVIEALGVVTQPVQTGDCEKPVWTGETLFARLMPPLPLGYKVMFVLFVAQWFTRT